MNNASPYKALTLVLIIVIVGVIILPSYSTSFEIWRCGWGSDGAPIPVPVSGADCITKIAIRENDIRICDSIHVYRQYEQRGKDKCYDYFQ